ncbi:thioredoxin family protein [Xanthobacteraceae bacterium Astr-EGSB]|uniref:thioredoxin family protein n=1 Tax=Astrobacterium formosum TaxID=3069710 RepID=UPI0027B32A4A|nr:thioredoxin family protein [Xanthobacteraceae bacterium Astr-EGSB]
MQTRRQVMAGTLALCGSAIMGQARAEAPLLGDDGLYRQPWFIDSFLELADDLETARRNGKRLAVMWELKGCPYCRETHLVNFARPDIADYVRSNFDVLQLNIIGARKVTDFDGSEMGEKQLAAKYAVRFTPSILFFPESAAGLGERPADKREVARAAGYYRPDDFLAMFRYVREKAYETTSFRDFLKAVRS